tara:strand:- start:367 stop:543 length:177 start_codon:yes stop_codon:yes gene_type:complete
MNGALKINFFCSTERAQGVVVVGPPPPHDARGTEAVVATAKIYIMGYRDCIVTYATLV